MRCVPAHDFTIGKAALWKGAIFDDAPYQRASTVWSLEQQQLFIDSLLNGFDVPKIYLHDLRGTHPTRVYAVVDGKQRLNTIWRFLADALPLADDFRLDPNDLPELPPGAPPPVAGARYSDLHPAWQRALRATHLAVVLIKGATEDDIEELFERLNNGEPLNAAEKRNAVSGTMSGLVREIAAHPYFADRLPFGNGRYRHLDVAARILLVEHAHPDDRLVVPDLRGPALDAFVRRERTLPASEARALSARVTCRLDRLVAVFHHADPLLGRPSWPTLAYLLVRRLDETVKPAELRTGLERFELAREAALAAPPAERDDELLEFSHLGEHGAHDEWSLTRRLEILAARVRPESHPTTPTGVRP